MQDTTVGRSKYSYAETIERLIEAIENAGATVFAKLDQAKAANSVGLALRPTTLLLFGNPKGGTGLMEAFPLSALDLPLKLLVWEAAGRVSVAFTPMSVIAERYGIVGKDVLLQAMDGMLASIVASSV
jgi:uncharacterized protein (DUF302 family)